MTCSDWRDETIDTLAPLYAAERRRWAHHLGWDLGPSLRLVEQARQAGEVPGLVLRDGRGAAAGWAYYVLSQGAVQIGALSAGTAGGHRLLLDRIFRSPEAHVAQELSCFLFPTSSSVSSALSRQRFALEAHDYLTAPLQPTGSPFAADSGGPAATAVRAWHESDTAPAVRLVARAYAGDAAARCFAPHGRLEEWAHYLGQLLAGPGCGMFQPAASLVVQAPETPSGLGGAVVTTLIAPGTAHIAQVVVDPVLRRSGLARALLHEAATRARDAGARRLTLLVSEHNAPARALYARLGFTRSAAFLYGHRGPAPRRFGGVRTADGAPAPEPLDQNP